MRGSTGKQGRTLGKKSARHIEGSTSGNGDCLTKAQPPSQSVIGPSGDGELSGALLTEENRDLERLLAEISVSCVDEHTGPRELQRVRGLLLRAARHLEEQAHLLLGLRSAALTDDLTGLYNRRGFLILGRQFLKLARRNGRAVLLFYCDVNQLKGINDEHGHTAGDACLVRCAAVLKDTFRKSDIVARFGGDEFVVLALETTTDSEAVILRRLRDAIRKRNADGPHWALSLSVGTARADSTNRASLSDLLIVADQEMYEDKRAQLGDSVRTSFLPSD